jgi:hypothetical protein
MTDARNKTVLAILFFAVVVSGCTGGGGSEEGPSQTASVQVNEFSAFPNPAPSEQSVRFRMQLENVGGADTNNATSVRLFNPPFGPGSNVWSDEDGNDVELSDRVMHFGELQAPGDQTPSTPRTQRITFTAPDLEEDRTISYDMNSYIMYEYSTEANTEVEIMGGERYREQGNPEGSAGLENTRGPIQMEVRTPTPLVFYDIDSTTDYLERELCVIVRNQGSGVPFGHEGSSNIWLGESEGWNLSAVQENENEVNVRIEDIGRVDFDPYGSSNPAEEIEILDGRGVNCWDMNVSVGSTAQIQTTIPLDLQANYGYRKTSRTTATVEGRR